MISVEFGMVLCAGLGVRLRPLTDVAPKPALRFLDRHIAEYALDALRSVGVSRIGLNAHHRPESISAVLQAAAHRWAESGGSFPQTTVVVEPELLGTGGGAFGIYERLGAPQGTICVINGDVIADFPLDAMLKVHRRTGASATLMVLPAVPGEAPVWLDADSRFVAQLPAPDGEWVSPRYAPERSVAFGGVYLVEPDVFSRLAARNLCLIRNGIGPLLREGAPVAAYRHDGFWADLGTPRRFLDATIHVLSNPTALPAAGLPERSDSVHVADRRALPPDVDIVGPALIAPGASIERGARVGPCAVIGAGCRVRAGAVVSDAILMDGAVATGELSRRIVCGSTVARVP